MISLFANVFSFAAAAAGELRLGGEAAAAAHTTPSAKGDGDARQETGQKRCNVYVWCMEEDDPVLIPRPRWSFCLM